jgi:TldD protein
MSQVRSVISRDSVAAAEEQMLLPAGLDLLALRRALDTLMSTAIDYGDLYFQSTRYETWSVEDGIVKEGIYSIDQGVGVRAVAGEKTGFAYADAIDADSLLDAVRAARGISRTKGNGRAQASRRSARRDSLYPPVDPLPSMTDRAKVDLLADLDKRVRGLDPRIIQVTASLAGLYDVVLVHASDGTLAADIRPLVRLNVAVILEHAGRREQGYSGGGGRGDFSVVTAADLPLKIGREAVRQAVVNLDAAPARRARAGMARRAAARGDRPWVGRRLQPQGHIGFHGTHRRAGRDGAVHGRRRRHIGRPARLVELR